MNCKDAQLNMALAVGQDLSPGETEAVRRHVAGCQQCSEQWTGLKVSMQALHQAKGEPADLQGRSVWGKVSRQIKRQTRASSQSRFNGWIPAVAVAAACLFLVIGSNFITAPAQRLTPAGTTQFPQLGFSLDDESDPLAERLKEYYPDESWKAGARDEENTKKDGRYINVNSAGGF